MNLDHLTGYLILLASIRFKSFALNVTQYAYLVFDLILIILFLPILLLLLILIRLKKLDYTDHIVLYGLDNVTTKTDNRGLKFRESGFEVTYFSFESTIGTLSKLEGGNLKIINSFSVIALSQFLAFYLRFKPKYVEVYFIKNYLIMYLVAKYSTYFNILTIAILRGSETMVLWKWKPLHRLFFIYTLKATDWIYYRELWMGNDLAKVLGIDRKLIFDFNKVRFYEEMVNEERIIDTIFINSFKKWRNIGLLLESLSIVVKTLPQSKHLIVGAKSDSEIEYYQKLTFDLGISGNVEIRTWTDDSKKILQISKIFLLPADIVFLNFSLLEAMERACAPIIWDVEGADKIIDNGINGIISKKNIEDLANNIIFLLNDEEKRIDMGANARRKIKNEFNDNDRLCSIIEKINDRFPE